MYDARDIRKALAWTRCECLFGTVRGGVAQELGNGLAPDGSRTPNSSVEFRSEPQASHAVIVSRVKLIVIRREPSWLVFPAFYGPMLTLQCDVSNFLSAGELRNTLTEVLRRVERGRIVTVTVDGRPVAELVPLRRRRTMSLEEARNIVRRHAADRGLLRDLRHALPDTTDDA